MRQSAELKLAFLGDSITEGCFEFYPCSYGFETQRHPEDGYAWKTVKLSAKNTGSPLSPIGISQKADITRIRRFRCPSTLSWNKPLTSRSSALD